MLSAKLCPDRATYWLRLASALSSLGQTDACLSALSALETHAPDYAKIAADERKSLARPPRGSVILEAGPGDREVSALENDLLALCVADPLMAEECLRAIVVILL